MTVGGNKTSSLTILHRPFDGELQLRLRVGGISEHSEIGRRSARVTIDLDVGSLPGARQPRMNGMLAELTHEHIRPVTVTGVAAFACGNNLQRFVRAHHNGVAEILAP